MNPVTQKGSVYVLIDCSSGDVFYVGMTRQPAKRMEQHRSKNAMLKKIEQGGGKVEMMIVFTGCIAMCAQIEASLIRDCLDSEEEIENKQCVERYEGDDGKKIVVAFRISESELKYYRKHARQLSMSFTGLIRAGLQAIAPRSKR